MTVMTHESFADTPIRQGIAPRLLVPGFWPAVGIVTMWLAVLVDGIFGGNINLYQPLSGQITVMPSAVAIALFAAIATWAVAKRGFARKDD